MHDTTLATVLGLGLVGLVTSLGCYRAAHAAPPADPVASLDAATLRARGPAALGELIARYDRMKPGSDRDALETVIDQVAQQRYATTSRLYWYTDLAQAQAEATRQGKPILALRMLGSLAEDWSCANSRLFRSTLYANTEVSAFMRDNFVLYWSSERAVPQVTIDMGDGRKIKTTITGNSAHYVLAADGAVLDVLPGVYAPTPFRTELAKSLALAKDVAKAPAAERTRMISRHHQQAQVDALRRQSALGSIRYLPDRNGLAQEEEIRDAAWRAQRNTMSKARIEVPLLREISFAQAATLDENNTAAWGALGQAYWGDRKPAAPSAPILDEASKKLVLAIYDAEGQRSTPEQRATMLQRLELNLVADSALNELSLRPQIRHQLIEGVTDFATVNAYVYDVVFHTPKSDAWLGLAPRTDFTGLPGDGLIATPTPRARTAQR